MKNLLKCIVALCVLLSLGMSATITCDSDEDCFYIPDGLVESGEYFPTLIILSCTGATAEDIDSILYIADSLHMIFATCHKSKNHRDIFLNDADIIKLYEKLIRNYPVDMSQVFIYGFSGQGVQALLELFYNPYNFRGVISVCAHRGVMSVVKWQELSNKFIFLISREEDWNLEDNFYMHNLFQLNGIHDTLVITPGEHSPATHRELYNACFWLLHKND
jgi:predicted esterase